MVISSPAWLRKGAGHRVVTSVGRELRVAAGTIVRVFWGLENTGAISPCFENAQCQIIDNINASGV
jgi:hypothetical protein